MKTISYLRISLKVLLLISCEGKQESNDKYEPHYLVEQVPEEEPKIYGKDIIFVAGRFDMGFTISPDGKSMAFGVVDWSKKEETCIYIMNFINGKWTKPDRTFIPENINTFFPMFNSGNNDFYYAKDRGDYNTDIWRAKYLNGKVVSPKPLDSLINSNYREAGHGKSEKGVLYFTSNRDLTHECCGDVYRTTSYNTIEKVEVLSSTADEESLFLASDESYIIIQAWKPQFKSKHDLYISYKTKKGLWTNPERLNSAINSESIEQRPFISPDNKCLFFSRMNVTREEGKEKYASDIYWISTKKIFKPYVYNSSITTDVFYEKPFKIDLPKDLFKHVNGTNLRYKISLQDNSELPNWIKFNSDSMSLNGIWRAKEQVAIKITATDNFENKGTFSFELENN